MVRIAQKDSGACDPKDSQWLAHLLRHGLIRPSFIPVLAVRELRDLTRFRRQLLNDSTSERNRVQKILEKMPMSKGERTRGSLWRLRTVDARSIAKR